MIMKTRAVAATILGLTALGSSAHAQIIATSIPREVATVTGKPAGQKKWAIHVMVSPASKWQVKDFFFADLGELLLNVPLDLPVGFTGKSDDFSKILLAAELNYSVGGNSSLGVGGWFNKIGELDTRYNVHLGSDTASKLGLAPGDEEIDRGKQDLGSFTEVHANGFWGNLGIQAGLVFESKNFLTGESRTDWDLYGVYRRSFKGVGAFSLGAGVFATGKTELEGTTVADPLKRLSGFATLSLPIYKGLSLDASYWYIAKSSDAKDAALDDSMNRWMVGVGYTF